MASLWAAQTSTSNQTSTLHSSTKSTKTHASKGKRSRKKSTRRVRGQKAIDANRARQIQQALIREHYLSGEPTGKWDDATQKAMQKFQADNGWQSKTTPDARALIKLGLGPDQQHLLNPESAMTAAPQARASQAPSPAATDDPEKSQQ